MIAGFDCPFWCLLFAPEIPRSSWHGRLSMLCYHLAIMLGQLRQSSARVSAILVCVLLATWLTGAHAHRPVANHGHSHAQALHGHFHHAHEDQDDNADLASKSSPLHEAAAMLSADASSDIELFAVHPLAQSKLSGDLPIPALVLFSVFLPHRPGGLDVSPSGDPPPPKSIRLLAPPSRGPPEFAS